MLWASEILKGYKEFSMLLNVLNLKVTTLKFAMCAKVVTFFVNNRDYADMH
ncbi:hypothetical protein BpOF4_21849 (plasmid) [Alkalihalophilus pseudofirmus OF4]|uniref:Uncharacterized protein n=1 Tax=Alkalihalophilus pseudofirmus (strain ATCC BAA-2126 / JCM 17055 / OF4) TaxID=398511 RepID=D3G1Y9_ALKPO|nr:hypothetical protein BpOF4_21849 [Alkalihalophilus pseudofirmus OF4]